MPIKYIIVLFFINIIRDYDFMFQLIIFRILDWCKMF